MPHQMIWTYGIFAGLINAIMAYTLSEVFGDQVRHYNAEWIGYLVMFAALSVIFMGIRQYRDQQLGGVIKFGKAFSIGMYIALVASLLYVGAWEIYMQTGGSDFMEQYTTSYLNTLKDAGATEAALEAAREEMNYYVELYKQPAFRMLITLSEILPVGIVISLVSATLLKK